GPLLGAGVVHSVEDVIGQAVGRLGAGGELTAPVLPHHVQPRLLVPHGGGGQGVARRDAIGENVDVTEGEGDAALGNDPALVGGSHHKGVGVAQLEGAVDGGGKPVAGPSAHGLAFA